jgi:integrase
MLAALASLIEWKIEMATVRKRTWTYKGETRTAWVLDYVDQRGKRHVKTYGPKKAADAALIDIGHEVKRGTHTADSESVTLAEACRLWVQRAEADGLERSTVAGYRQHVDIHIIPAIGGVKLSRLTAPGVEQFKDELQRRVSRPLAAKIMGSLRRALSDAMRRGLVGQNVAREVAIKISSRDKAGIQIPTKDDVRALLAAACPRFRPLLLTLLFAGLRISEARGLRWDDIDLDQGVLHVRQRADRWNAMGKPKSKAGRRDIPMPPVLVNSLREWRLRCPRGELGLAFPNGIGKTETLQHIAGRYWGPLQVACGITRAADTSEGDSPIQRPRYGLHACRHWYASFLIDQGWAPKRIQTAMGHSSIVETFDTYGHLFPQPDDELQKLAISAAAMVG